MPLRLGPADIKLEFVNEFVLVRNSLCIKIESLTCSCDGVRSPLRNELRRLIEPLRLNERLNESLKKQNYDRKEKKKHSIYFTYPRLTNPFDVVLNCLTR